ncbi:RNA-binding protein 20-like [Patiria miniata]|uniref:Matrin-type domain-containing protein n=1 Tax=Patiria miniata TaxID=46514 RepID=A0A913Z3I1_PATMI|nr:RNA-binding protein 20-like [Patiria miniata]
MYWQQDQRQQQGMHGGGGRGNMQQASHQQTMQGRANMQQASSGWGSPPGTGSTRPSLLDMSGNLRNDPGMRSPTFGSPQGSNLGSSRGGGLLPSPSMGMRTPRDMLGKLDNDIDELMATKIRIQQAMLSAASDEGGADRQQGFQPQARANMNQQRQQRQPQQQQQRQGPQQQQQYQQQDRRRNSSGGPMGRNGVGGARPGNGMRDGGAGRRQGGAGASRGRGREAPGAGNRERRNSNRGQNMQRKRSNSEIYDPARPTDDEVTSIGRPVDDLQVTIRQQSRGRAVTDEGGPVRKKPMQSPRQNSSTATSVDMEAEKNSSWFCHVCSVTCRNIKVYQTHMTGKKHLEAMEKIREVATFQSDQAKARLQAQNYLRKLESGGGSGGRGGGEGRGAERRDSEQRAPQRYCRDCHRYFRGERFDHLKSEAHKDAKKKSKPHCAACDLSFKTTQKYVQHCKGDMHKKRRGQQSQEGTSTEEENYVTVDAVGFDDDIDLDAELLEMQLKAEEEDHPPEPTPSKETEDVVIISDNEESREPSQEKEVVVVFAESDHQDMPDLEPASEDETSAKEDLDQASTSQPVDEPSGSTVPDVQVIEPAKEETTESPMAVQEGTTNKSVALCPDGSDSASHSGLKNLKITVTFDNQPLSDLQSASDVQEGEHGETQSAGPSVPSGESESVAAVGSEDQAEDQAGDQAEDQAEAQAEVQAKAEQTQSDQAQSSEVVGESEGATPMDVEPTSGVSATPEQQQQEEQKQQEDITELVFDPNKSVGQEYLVPVSGFFCKLCHKFLTSDKASRAHCKGKSHFQAVKASLKKTKSVDDSSEPNSQASN